MQRPIRELRRPRILHQNLVQLADESKGEGEFLRPLQPVIERGYVMDDIIHIRRKAAPRLSVLRFDNILNGRLCALYLAGIRRILFDEHAKERIAIGQ